MELLNRIDLEQEFAAKLNKLNDQFRHEILNEMGGSLDPLKITAELWQRVQQEYDREMKSVLAMLFLLSLNTHTVRRDIPLQADRYQLAALQYAHDRTAAVLPRFISHSQERLQTAAPEWASKADAEKSVGEVFGPDRANRMSQTETSAAQADGGMVAIKIQGLHVKYKWEHSRVRPKGHAGAAVDPCKICTPMEGKWHWEWRGLLPGKAHPHCDCYPAAYDIITGQKLPFEYPDNIAHTDGFSESLSESFDESKHPRDDGGRFVSESKIAAAKSDPKKAAELRAQVTDPANRKKLDKMLGHSSLSSKKESDARNVAATKQRQANRVPEQKLSEKAKIARKNCVVIDASVQRYSEEHNEPSLAKNVGGRSELDNKPYDVAVLGGGKIKHGIELKTMVVNGNDKITMKGSAQDRKIQFEKEHDATFHTVIYDDRKVFNAKGSGKHGSEADRVIYYRRGGGSFRVGSMYRVANPDELKKLIAMKDADLPTAAQPSPQWKQRQAAMKVRRA